jgi:hypothetical protein
MRLSGSCHCGAVKFKVESHTPYPFMRCYCSICRKTQGGGGYAINIMGDADTLDVKGKRNLSVYRAKMARGKRSTGRRHFCKRCGSALWLWDPSWPQWVYPFASAIDTRLPKTPETVSIMLNYAPSWTEAPHGRRDKRFREYPKESIEAWHKKRGLFEDRGKKSR